MISGRGTAPVPLIPRISPYLHRWCFPVQFVQLCQNPTETCDLFPRHSDDEILPEIRQLPDPSHRKSRNRLRPLYRPQQCPSIGKDFGPFLKVGILFSLSIPNFLLRPVFCPPNVIKKSGYLLFIYFCIIIC